MRGKDAEEKETKKGNQIEQKKAVKRKQQKKSTQKRGLKVTENEEKK